MAIRNLLHKNKLEDFKRWLISKGWELEPTRGVYEALRARRGNGSPLIIFAKDDHKEHVTVQSKDFRVVKAYLRDSRLKKEVK